MSGMHAPQRVTATLLALLTVLWFVGSAAPAWASADVQVAVEVNGEPVELDPPAVILRGRTFVPLRGLLERLGASVTYHAETGEIVVSRGSVTIQLSVDAHEVVRNGQAGTLDDPPFLLSGRTYVPARFVTEALGDRIEWLQATSTLRVWSAVAAGTEGEGAESDGSGDGAAEAPAETATPRIPYTPEEFELLARVINAEAYGQPYLGMVAVGAVIINRVLSPQFPDTIYDVIHQPGQFKVVANGQMDRPVTEEAYRAAMEALLGVDPTQGALFFFNARTASSQFLFSRPVTVVIGDHTFAR